MRDAGSKAGGGMASVCCVAAMVLAREAMWAVKTSRMARSRSYPVSLRQCRRESMRGTVD